MSTNPRRVVLLVEDEMLVRMDAADNLEGAGFEVIETANADAAFEALCRRGDIQVLFTDIRMPGSMDGLALARLVHDRWPHIAVVITSGHGRPDEPEMPPWAAFIPKPYSDQTPTAIIRSMTGA